MIALIENDLEEGLPNTNTVASDAKDRGVLCALVWSEKVTRIQKSLLTRYQKRATQCWKIPAFMFAQFAALFT